MKTVKRKSMILRVSLFMLIGVSAASAQFPDDALRFSSLGYGVGSRSLGMGNAYTGVANDFTALYWNPAGLAQMERSEFQIGISNLNYQNSSEYFGSVSTFSNNGTALNSLGLAFVAPTQRGSLVLAFGFSRQSTFTTGLAFSGYNPSSSIVQAWAPDGQQYPPNVTIAEELGLATADTTTGRFVSPIKGDLNQEGTVLEGGGVDNWSIGGAIDVAENLSTGVTLSFLSGSYQYDRNYIETDVANVYEEFPYDFNKLVLDEFIRSDISGFNANFGLMYRVPGFLRFGLSVRTPTTFSVHEDFGQIADSYFDNGDILPVDDSYRANGTGEYKVVTPWTFSGGLSLMILNFVFAGDLQYTDWTQLHFDDAHPDVMAQNPDFKEIFRPAANVRLGAEWNPFALGLRFRAGAIYNQSPYKQDASQQDGEFPYDQKFLTAGIGLPLGGYAMLDVAYAYGWWKTDRLNYDLSSRVIEDVKTHNVLATFSFRF